MIGFGLQSINMLERGQNTRFAKARKMRLSYARYRMVFEQREAKS